MNVNKIVLVGGGAFTRELINYVYDVNHACNSIEILGFLDASADAMDSFNYGLEYMGAIEEYKPDPNVSLLMGIGDPLVKERYFHHFKKLGASFYTLVHPTAVVSRTAILGEGVVVCPQAILSADARVGDLVALNGCASVGHDVTVGSFCTLSSHVDLTGWVKVGDRVFFGSGARVIPKVRIGNGAQIGAGAVVMMHVPESATVYAPPARKL